MKTINIAELLARCDGSFIPRRLDDFIGRQIIERQNGDTWVGARLIAELVVQGVQLANANQRSPLKYLLNGRPGLGKSALVAYLQQLLSCNKWNTIKLNGTECKVEMIREIAQQLAHTSLFGDWRMLWIDEADAIPPVAQVRFLTLLDDLPRGIAIACTSNCKLRDFDERFQTRFQAFEIAPPTTGEIISLLRRYLPDEPEVVNAANFADGNVRQALLDTKGLVQRSLQLLAA
ncbi:MAG: AAA family ATPase [Pedosphaera sp.]|nr:AAA family ATPase [Pedosphaera sp.]